MKHTLPALDVDLLIEHDGHHMKLRGSAMRFVAKFPTLLSLAHFMRFFWSSRKRIPHEASVHLEWRQLSIPVKAARANQLQ